MNEQRLADAAQAPPTQPLSQPPQRILARRMARELTTQELEQVSGGRMSAGHGHTATSVCCDCDACDS